MTEIEDYMDTDDFRFTQVLLNDTSKEALVAMYYTALHTMSEADEIDLFEVHNNIIDSLNQAQDATTVYN
tara:strand:- start:119 stop:328 length:210 start_codon:yes stop_codon:yes gene_type:complete